MKHKMRKSKARSVRGGRVQKGSAQQARAQRSSAQPGSAQQARAQRSSVQPGSAQRNSAQQASTQRNRVHDARSYKFKSAMRILLDTNVLLHLQPPSSGRKNPVWDRTNRAVFQRLLKAQAVPVVDVLVLSEYFNRCLRLEYAAYCQHHRGKNFKAFRLSTHGLRALAKAVARVEEILKHCQLTNTDVEALDMRQVLRAVATGTVDFNDGILIASCQQHGWKLLTNDGDMTSGGIEVITTNPKLLRG